MDPKMLKILRAFLGVDDKILPDSMTPEAFGKFVDDQKGKSFGNPEDFKNLQKIISQKDKDFRLTKEAYEKLKINKPKDDKKETEIEILSKALKKELEDIKGQLKIVNQAKETENLQKKYPDILPEFLVGKDEEQQKAVVEKQRSMNKKLYGDSRQFTQPTYDDVKKIDAEIGEIKEDKSLSGEKSAVKVLQLGRIRENLEVSPLE